MENLLFGVEDIIEKMPVIDTSPNYIQLMIVVTVTFLLSIVLAFFLTMYMEDGKGKLGKKLTVTYILFTLLFVISTVGSILLGVVNTTTKEQAFKEINMQLYLNINDESKHRGIRNYFMENYSHIPPTYVNVNDIYSEEHPNLPKSIKQKGQTSNHIPQYNYQSYAISLVVEKEVNKLLIKHNKVKKRKGVPNEQFYLKPYFKENLDLLYFSKKGRN